MSREALGDAVPDAVDDRTGADDVPTTVLATISVDRPAGRAADGAPLPLRPGGTHGADADLGPRDAATHAPTEDLDLDLTGHDHPGDPGGPADAATAPPGGPVGPARGTAGNPLRRPRLVPAAIGVGLLVLGVFAGTTSARQQGQARLDAAARIVIAVQIDPDLQFGGADTSSPDSDVLQTVQLSMAGSLGDAAQVTVERLRTRFGDFDVYAQVTTRAGKRPVTTLLKGRPDCARAVAVSPGVVSGTALDGAVAVVRPQGSRRDVEVPVLVSNPEVTMASVEYRCHPPAQVDDPYNGPSYSVGALVARADGSLDFVLGPGTAFPPDAPPSRFVVLTAGGQGPVPYDEARPTSRSGGSATYTVPDTRWTLTTTPALPLQTQKPTFVRVRFHYACVRFRRSTPPALPAPPDVRLGTVSRNGVINMFPDGWDDAAMQSAMAAAAVTACGTATPGITARPGSSAGRPPGGRQP